MKPLAFNLKNAKKVGAGDNHSVFKLENGHEIKVAHGPLSALQRKQIEALPVHYEDGGTAGIADKDADIFSLNSSAISRGITGKYLNPQNSINNMPDDELTGDEAEGLDRGYAVQVGAPMQDDEVKSQNIGGYAQGGEVEEQPLEPLPEGMPTPDGGNVLVAKEAVPVAVPVDQPVPVPVPSQSPVQISISPGETQYSNPITKSMQGMQGAIDPALLKSPEFKTSPDDPYGSTSAIQTQIDALKNQKNSALQQTQIESNAAYQGADVERQAQDVQKQQMNRYQESLATIRAERDKISQDVMNGHINPTRFVQNMSSGSKIIRGIGLLLGGFGAGLTGTPNYAFQALQNDINNDILSQVKDLGKKENLLGHNLQAESNLNNAMQLTALQTNQIFASKLRQNAMFATNAAEKAKLLGIAGQFDGKIGELEHNIAIQKALLNGSGNSGHDIEQEFQNRMRYLRLNGREKDASELEKKHVPGIPGLASRDLTKDDHDEWANFVNLQKGFNNAQSYLNEVGQLGAGYLRANPGLAAKGKSIQEALKTELSKFAAINRLTDNEIEIFTSRIPDLTGTHFSGVDQQKISQLQKELKEKADTYLATRGFPIVNQAPPVAGKSQVSHAPFIQGDKGKQDAYNFAVNHPDDPRSKMIFKKLGIK